MGTPEIVVIGAGVGGIALAARLARQGARVTVFEKNDGPGGRCDRWVWEGHRFDTGPTLLLMPEIFAETYAELGERLEDHLALQRVNPTYLVYFEDGTVLQMTADLPTMRDQLEALEPGSFTAFLRYLADGHRFYQVARREFIGRNFRHWWEYFSPARLPLLMQLRALTTHYRDMGRYFRDPRLRAAFTFQDMYLGLSPFEAPATYALLAASELTQGVWFPQGGMYRVVESLVAIAEGHGVRFHYHTPVAAIEVDGDRATGIRLENGERVRADLVVANADLPYVYRCLLPPGPETEALARLRYTCSAITFYWGLREPLPTLWAHNVFLAGDYRGSFEQIFQRLQLPEVPSFYVHAPARLDPDAAPPGEDTVMVLVPTGHLLADGQAAEDLEAAVERSRTAVEEHLARFLGRPLGPLRKFERVYTPRTWQTRYHLERGSAFGLSHTFTQVGYMRPANRHLRYRNLYFVGASTHPGTGLPIVLLSARLTAQRIVEEWAAWFAARRHPVLTTSTAG